MCLFLLLVAFLSWKIVWACWIGCRYCYYRKTCDFCVSVCVCVCICIYTNTIHGYIYIYTVIVRLLITYPHIKNSRLTVAEFIRVEAERPLLELTSETIKRCSKHHRVVPLVWSLFPKLSMWLTLSEKDFGRNKTFSFFFFLLFKHILVNNFYFLDHHCRISSAVSRTSTG